MRYFWAVVFPPLAVLLCGKPGQFVLNILLTICFWLPGIIHAWGVSSQYYADRRQKQLLRAMRQAR